MNKKLIIITGCLLFLLFGVGTIYKVVKGHHDHLLLVSHKLITEKAQLCFESKKCSNDIVKLKDLYALNFLERQVNPITKEYYNDKSYVKKEENQYIFVNVD